MAAIQQRPTSVKDYYKSLKEEYNNKLEKAKTNLENNIKNRDNSRKKLEHYASYYKKCYDIDINRYEDFKENDVVNGKLLEVATKFYRNAKDETERRHSIMLLRYAQSINNIRELTSNIEKYKKILALSYKEYCHYVRTYYYEVQRQMIVNGYAYEFEGDTGSICINRCKNLKRKPIIDTKATNENKKKLLAEGKELYNPDKAAYCKDHAIPYNGVEYRIFKKNDYLYEFVLIWSKLPNDYKHKFEPVDNWSLALRGKTKEDFKAEAKGDLNYICNLDITFRTKVTICNEIDETLYLNFIRNEHQTPITASKNYR